MYRLTIADGSEGAGAVGLILEEWLAVPALRRLVELDGGTWPTDGPLFERLEHLHDVSQRWDFRGGVERMDMPGARQELDDARIFELAAPLGLTGAPAPSRERYDHAVVLGGTALATVNRIRRLRELLDAGIDVRDAGVLTALRHPIPDAERILVTERPELSGLLDGVETEFDVSVNAAQHFFGGPVEITRHVDEEEHRSSASASVGSLFVLAAPSSDPARRADTADNYRVWADRLAPGESVLVVTSSVYLPFQFFAGILALGWDRPLTLEATGFPPEWMGGVLTGAENVLQELRSAFFWARSLAWALDGAR